MTGICPKCKKLGLRQQVNLFLDVPADCRNLSKKALRNSDIQVLGAGWPTATFYCPYGCGYRLDLGQHARESDESR